MNSDVLARGRLPDLVTLYKILFLALVAAFVSVPLLATVLGGFKSLGELRTSPFGIPQTWEWQNYAGIVLSKRYWQLLGNSLVIASLTVSITLVVASMAAFVFAHVKFFGSRLLLSYLTMGLLFPAATAVLPLFIKVRDLGLLDTYFGLMIFYASTALPSLVTANLNTSLPAILMPMSTRPRAASYLNPFDTPPSTYSRSL